jgi:transposase
MVLEVDLPEGYIIIKESVYLDILARLTNLERENAELRQRLNMNSGNSHKPPSSDGYSKKPVIKNNRVKGDKRQGAQPGHKGSTLMMSEKPDRIVEIDVHGTCDCGRALTDGELVGFDRSQVLDLVPVLTQTTEYRGLIRVCVCGLTTKAGTGHRTGIQYGNGIRALAVYLNQQQFIPYNRLQQTIRDVFGISISDCLLTGANKQCYDQLEEFEQENKLALSEEGVLNCDETGERIEGLTQWVHTTSSDSRTHYQAHPKRGREAIDHIGILTDYKGISVHDRFSSYDKYDCAHALCNAHLLRDLTWLIEEDKKLWAKQMKRLLLMCNTYKNEGLLKKTRLKSISREYDRIIAKHKSREMLLQPPPTRGAKYGKKRGRPKRTKSLCLLEVFEQRKDQILHFLYNPIVPFDNNLAERDLRMVKLKQKISGCFRTYKGAEIFCRIRSYISTARKQNINIMQALKAAIEGKPVSFA